MPKRILIVAQACLVLLAACGGSDEPGATVGQGSAPESDRIALEEAISAPLLDAADRLIDSFGPDGAFDVVVSALEFGYSSEQIVDGASSGEITGDGLIPGIGPEFVSLGGAAGRGISTAPRSIFAAQSDGDSLRKFKEEVLTDASILFLGVDKPVRLGDEEVSLDRDQSRALIGMLLALASAGYSSAQLIGLFTGASRSTLAVARVNGFNVICPVMADGGTVVPPQRAGLGVFGMGGCAQYYENLVEAAEAASPDTTTTESSAVPQTGGIVASGPFPVTEAFGTVITNEYRVEACFDGRLFVTGDIQAEGDIGRTFLIADGDGIWDPATGMGQVEMINTGGLVGGDSDTGPPFSMSVVVTGDSITIDVADDSQDPLELPIRAGEPTSQC